MFLYGLGVCDRHFSFYLENKPTEGDLTYKASNTETMRLVEGPIPKRRETEPSMLNHLHKAHRLTIMKQM